MDQLSALRTFMRIAESGTFAKAADSLNLPRATATKLIQDLERHVGAKLLTRTTRRVSVTPEGAAYYERAQRLIAELDDMDMQAGRAGGVIRGRLRVDIGSSLANIILIPSLPDFHCKYPDIDLVLGVSDRPIDLIGEGVDCVVRGGVLADTSLIARRLAELDYVTCATPDYFVRHGIPVRPEDLRSGHTILSYFSSATGKPFPLLFERGNDSVEILGSNTISVNESTAHMTGLVAGLGIGQTFKFAARPHLESGALTQVLAEWSRPRHPLHILYPPSRHLNARLRVFVDWVVERFAEFDDRKLRE